MVNYLYEKGTLFVAPGGGAAATPIPPGDDGQVLIRDDSDPLGVSWQDAVPGDGDVVGPGSAVSGNLASFDGTTGKIIEDSGVDSADVTIGAASAVSGNFAAFSGTSGKILGDSGVSTASFKAAPVVGGGAGTKGTFSFTSGTSGDISTTAALTASVICVTITALGTVTTAQATYCAITNGTKFIIHSADATDTSSGTWAIVA